MSKQDPLEKFSGAIKSLENLLESEAIEEAFRPLLDMGEMPLDEFVEVIMERKPEMRACPKCGAMNDIDAPMLGDFTATCTQCGAALIVVTEEIGDEICASFEEAP